MTFDDFWTAYPRKKGKGAARRAWDKAMRTRAAEDRAPLAQAIVDAVLQQKTWPEWDDPKFVPHPSTWLNQERWNDERDPEPSRPDPLFGHMYDHLKAH